jgi:hypothetical protein
LPLTWRIDKRRHLCSRGRLTITSRVNKTMNPIILWPLGRRCCRRRHRRQGQKGGKKQTAYGIFAQACLVQYPGDEAAIREFHIQCSDWWYDLSEQKQEQFQGFADRIRPLTTDGIIVSFLPTTTVRSLPPSHKIYRIGASCSAAEHQTSTTLLLLPPRFPHRGRKRDIYSATARRPHNKCLSCQI